MSARMRLVGWEVRPIVMADDGENLAPINVNPQMIPAAAWQTFKDGGDSDALDKLRAQIESNPAD